MITPKQMNPLFPNAVLSRGAGSGEVQQDSSRKRGILVVDDDAGARNVLGAWMRHQGCTVWLADGGQEAIGIFMRHADVIDIVFMDVHMPNREGPQTLAILRALRPQVHCCFLSANNGANAEEDLLAMSDATILGRPFRFTEIPLMLWELAGPVDPPEAFEDHHRHVDRGLENSGKIAALNLS